MKIYGIEMEGKFLGEKLATLPSWQASDEGRLVYAQDVDKLYVGTNASWTDLTSETVSAQTLSTLPTWQASDEGRIVYVRDEEKFYGGSDATTWVSFSGVSSETTLPVWTPGQEGIVIYDLDTQKLYFGGPAGWITVAEAGELLQVATLSSWTADDEGRMVYVQDEEKVYYGDGTAWVEFANADSEVSSSMELSITSMSNQTAVGTKTDVTVGENVSFGELLYLKADGKYWKSDADASTTMPAEVMAIATILADAVGQVLVMGFARDTSWSWTLGNGIANLLYATTTAGDISQTAPSGSGDQVQVIGYAHESDITMFSPQLGLLEI
jgi:hypothetical protein